jgi:hypothetical protein
VGAPLPAAAVLRAPAAPAVAHTDAAPGAALSPALAGAARARFARAADAFVAERASLATNHGARACRHAPDDDLIAAVERVVVGNEAA